MTTRRLLTAILVLVAIMAVFVVWFLGSLMLNEYR